MIRPSTIGTRNLNRLTKLAQSIWIGVVLGSCSVLVNQFAFHPMRADADELGHLPAPVVDLDLTNPDGTRIHALYLQQKDRRQPLILYFHGNAGHVYHRLPYGRELFNRGYSVLMVEYRGYGRSTGKPSESGVYQDARTARQFLLQTEKWPAEQIVILGRSLGSAVAVDLAAEYPPAALILITPFASAYDVARQTGLGAFAWAARGAFDSAAKIASIQAPLLIIQGDRDQITPLPSARSLFAASPLPSNQKQFLLIPGAGHNDIVSVDAERYWATITGFIKQHSN
ncbi:MAG: alpha/beta hydrolase [Leptospiraceae bacterium]|nr:alpha/beta hydrolase [Leptospiraceae bacterium]